MLGAHKPTNLVYTPETSISATERGMLLNFLEKKKKHKTFELSVGFEWKGFNNLYSIPWSNCTTALGLNPITAISIALPPLSNRRQQQRHELSFVHQHDVKRDLRLSHSISALLSATHGVVNQYLESRL